ncbi:MAG: class I lanthipeptide [Bacteroidales bacterium]
MKKKKLNLSFNKETVSNLEMSNLKGGNKYSDDCTDTISIMPKTKSCTHNNCPLSNAPCPTINDVCNTKTCVASDNCNHPIK